MRWRVITYDANGKDVPWPDRQFDTEAAAMAESERRVAEQALSQATVVLSPDVAEESVILPDKH
jgi:hypothetical protein